MTNPKEVFNLPAQRNFELATKRTLELNRSHFLAVQDFDKISRQAGAVLQPPFIHLKYFRFRVEIDTRNAAVTSQPGYQPVPPGRSPYPALPAKGRRHTGFPRADKF
ncbi:hypothetical protein [Dehalococcoides mccartyi]|uniref:hypothetical protein n=1 Tax=Dehalococcoides mccartyi TaxID=61435 RepID=UPI001AF4825F|nr:hypothetical protein [Dehalococcoides mccartyi]BCT55807.1 hypothetical protein DHCNIT_0005700 [Dehalococcoides mccartyi]